ncbi:Peptidoglycan-binding lysin domain protein OS=Tsukamurella paurometabola (strain ATCC 8368 / DSM/ CCUG 35730 / CIP 100753 / JCM 10117 / KCTC 9821 / NBRC 16120 / NCIMB 702349 / NCTC 13040) OX=521096 GN=Tpau_1809 PE=4 SV=1 [Tsukamurella paurometabola]|uniref:Peptidoglycan-binding lysin domain protein n=1 Tax=Tsukamurella paurometabola (strain ATCC 8368 / DSM 20162 / CCUG 35730 / CIP 100753 / JCM 10117 / KCTC 9821 / NBRC 16120 / NCIMB 702349 / NCTC 13040) TaxID=521096 RepID=D5UMT0_TSUPD|nr:hypothetical protein [Tsukamurella paurometabola]ADG78427.1 Peptidoglycan-binding lysin domain protein [Tsukamurella paurometabola DSM 20162]SUP31591.1 Uncharacterised protein [Tsukamurella paurometabola]
MTAIIDRDTIEAGQSAPRRAGLVGHGTAATVHRRGAAQARGLSPRLVRSRSGEGSGDSITVSNTPERGDVRTAGSAPSAIRVVGARGARTRSIERIRVRESARRPRGYSRADGCARRSPRPTWLACVLAAAATFATVVLLFGGASPEPQAAPVSAGTPALTSVVTVRSGQTLEQVAREIAPERPVASVVDEVSRINGLTDGRVRAGQTLVTPRY